MRQYLITLLAFAALLLSGCSTIMRPPPAAAFMDSYGKDNAIRSASVSTYFGNLDNGVHEHDGDESHLSRAEWWGDVTYSNYVSGGYFTLGWGFQSITPFFQTGFVSKYFGLTGWSNFALIYPNNINNLDFMSHYSGGAMAIQQLPLNDRWTIGLTEHISRNGRETYNIDDECCSISIPEVLPEFYLEYGAGMYVSSKINDVAKISLEFRYGRDYKNERNRFALTISSWFGAKPIGVGGNDQMKWQAKRDSLKFANANFVSREEAQNTNMHTINKRWFKVSDTTSVTATIYRPRENLTTVISNSVCYDESTNLVQLLQPEDSTIVEIPLDSIERCEEAEMSIKWPYALMEGALTGTLAGLFTWNSTVGLITGGLTAAGVWGLLKSIGEPTPQITHTMCTEALSKNAQKEWFMQYPCSEPATTMVPEPEVQE